MADVRLIDANALKEAWRARLKDNKRKVKDNEATRPYCHFESLFADALCEYLDSAPSVDTVHVVRCRECVHNEDEDVCPFVRVNRGKNWLEIIKPHPDGFCHKGAKMDGGAENV